MTQTQIPDRNSSHQAQLPPARLLPAAQVKPAFSIRDYLGLFFKHKLGILTAFLTIIAGAVFFVTFIYIPKYQAKSLMLVKFGWETFSPDLSLEGKNKPIINQAELIQSEVRIVHSRDLLEKVVNSLKPESIYPELIRRPILGMTNTEAAVSLMDKDLTIGAARGNIIEVAYTSEYPSVAASVVNQLVNFHIERRNEIFKDPKSVIFLQKKLDEYTQKLADAEKKLMTFKNDTQIVSFDDQRKLLLNQQSNLVKALQECEGQKKENSEKVIEYERQMSVVPKMEPGSPESIALRITGTEAKLLQLRLNERELLARYKEDNKLVVGVREQIQITEKYLEAQSKLKPAEAINPTWRHVYWAFITNQADLNAVNAREAIVKAQLGEHNVKLQAFEDLETKNNELSREVVNLEEKFRSYQQRLEEAKIQDELERQKMTSVSIIERAAVPGIPINPLKPGILIPGIIAFAVIGSLGFGFLLEFLSHGVSTPTDAEKRLQLPVLVSISIKN